MVLDAPLLFFAVDLATITLAALIGLRVFVARPTDPTGALVGLLALAVVAHVVLGLDDYSAWFPQALQVDVGAWRPALNLARNAGPGLFMLLVHRLFSDRARPPWPILALFGLQLFLEEPVQAFLPLGASLPHVLAEVVPTLLQALFAVLAVYWTVESWSRDLVEARRRVRVVLVVILGVNVVASSVLLRVVIPPDTPANFQAHLVLSVLTLATQAGLAMALMHGDAITALSLPPAARAPSTSDARDVEALAVLLQMIERDDVHREPGLSLKVLADRVQLPEYRLRRLIHRELGFRNFNAFLHHYRIADACRQLRDPAQRRTPILTIALSVGYVSVNTFNRGFRDVMGMAPSAFRNAPDAGASRPNP